MRSVLKILIRWIMSATFHIKALGITAKDFSMGSPNPEKISLSFISIKNVFYTFNEHLRFKCKSMILLCCAENYFCNHYSK